MPLKKDSNFVKLRYTISLLGEYFNWWPTKVLSGKGEEFLEYVIPKTKVSAANQLATEISRLEHDKHIGPGRYHLFRLPQKWEEQIFNELKNETRSRNVLDENELMKELLEMSSGISIAGSKGPLLVGTHDELKDEAVLQSIARHYYEAFKNNYKTYPYLN